MLLKIYLRVQHDVISYEEEGDEEELDDDFGRQQRIGGGM